ncbi:unnamed protein product [Mycena citricolor]|uniref:Protein kinase domain-containing protein n=1 Tax=Mycena citricolor TaxID=2018698 RepID=A0AAD2JXB1_9AGAR|nr:unnamed protein product [Mycena citricolor]
MSPISYALPDLTGTVVNAGRLQLVRLLGVGSYGRVYQAKDTSSSESSPIYYAVKCQIHYDPATSYGNMLDNEIELHSSISYDDRILAFHRTFLSDDDKFFFTVLDYCAGGDLYGAIQEGRFDGNVSLVKVFMNQLLDGVAYMHRNSTYHRDLKPENILLKSSGDELDVKIADFGLSTRVGVSSQFGCGSRLYMSPENLDRLVAGGSYFARDTDLWACAVILVNVLTSRFPWFKAERSDPGYKEYLNDPSVLRDALNITQPTADLLNWCFSKKAALRPTLDEFRDAMNAIDEFVLPGDRTPAPHSRFEIPSLGFWPAAGPPPPPAVLDSLFACDCSLMCSKCTPSASEIASLLASDGYMLPDDQPPPFTAAIRISRHVVAQTASSMNLTVPIYDDTDLSANDAFLRAEQNTTPPTSLATSAGSCPRFPPGILLPQTIREPPRYPPGISIPVAANRVSPRFPIGVQIPTASGNLACLPPGVGCSRRSESYRSFEDQKGRCSSSFSTSASYFDSSGAHYEEDDFVILLGDGDTLVFPRPPSYIPDPQMKKVPPSRHAIEQVEFSRARELLRSCHLL